MTTKKKSDPIKNAYRALIDQLAINNKGLSIKVERFIKNMDPERYKDL